MKKRHKPILECIVGVCIVITLILTCATYQLAEQPSYEYLKSVTVFINGSGTAISPDGSTVKGTWAGTGVIINVTDNYTYILTNAHVAGNNCQDVQLSIEDGEYNILAKVLKFHPKLDMAILRMKGQLTDKQQIRGIAHGKPQDKAYIVGHHLGRKYIYGEGVYAGYDGDDILVQLPTLWGNSGSGVFNKSGKLVGLVYAISIRQISIFPVVDVAHALAVDSNDIEEFISEYVY
jgi:S1-C subfamily serine protease